MKDLADVRAELARLQRRESELRKEFSDTCEAVAERKVVIDELIKASIIPYINRLPTELLAQIFLIVKDERHILASVSRRWRAVLTDTPEIWGEIYIWDYYSCPWLLELHLERSRQTPLSIIADLEDELLDVVLLHVNRIHSLSVRCCAPEILGRISSLNFPCLQCLSVRIETTSVDLLSTIHSCVPALKCLELEIFGSSPGYPYGIRYRNPPRIVAAELLEELSLDANTSHWIFEEDSIPFPLLQRLTLDISDPIPLLEAIVAPKLTYFRFSGRNYHEPTTEILSGNWSRSLTSVSLHPLMEIYSASLMPRPCSIASGRCFVAHVTQIFMWITCPSCSVSIRWLTTITLLTTGHALKAWRYGTSRLIVQSKSLIF
ncbi:hypothetical protein EDC04DRAFT_1388645 [Pisolithus marmoratus]|nr:hypothetical protein EDC04DRAFT_1388645 [Pisolithus marmoratus]